MTQDEKLIRIKNYDELTLKTFIRGLLNPIKTNVRLRNPDSLEKATSLLIEEEHFVHYAESTISKFTAKL